MLLIGVVVGLAVGLLAGGHLAALINLRFRFAALLAGALVVRYGTQALIARDVPIVDMLRLPLYTGAFALLIATLWLNRSHAGLLVVMVGVASNALAIIANFGWMPVYVPALAIAGLGPGELSPTYHVALPAVLGLDFLLHAGPLGDVIPFPAPLLPNVVSIGDVLMSVGLGWFVVATLLRGDPDPHPAGIALWRGESPEATAARVRTGMDRPVVLGGGVGPGRVPPGAGATRGAAPAAGHVLAPAIPAVRPSFGARARAHPYLRLVRDARFSAFWLGQTVSVFGDRLHQVALGVLVLGVTNSPVSAGLVFVAATLPNILLGPIAGTFVDRWDHKRVMIISDLLRAGLVLLVPVVAQLSILLVYPLVFLVTTVSLFFRPAKAAVVPRLVRESDLMAANSAIWTGDTMADILGYPIAALFVAFLLGPADALGNRADPTAHLALAFWIDSATYVVSALLVGGLLIPPVVREVGPRLGGAVRAFAGELADGWRLLRGEPALLQNTLISAVAQISVGATIALTLVYARDSLDGRYLAYPESWGAIEAAIGLGNLVGGLAVGIIGARVRKGRMVVLGFVVMGASAVVMGLTANVLVALAASAVIGVFNLVYVIPTQTLFGLLTPPELMGRVVALRSSLVFGVMTGAMAVCSLLAQSIPAGTIIAATGFITVVSGLAGALLPAVRDA